MRHTGMMLWAEIFVLVALTTCVAVGFVYIALDDPPTDHLMGGELSVSLVRTGLATCLPEQDGRLITRFMNNEKDFSHATGESVFGEEAGTALLVPGCFLDATLVIQNTGDTACAFFVELSYPEEATGASTLAEQLTVHITHPDGSVTQAPLAELPNGQLLLELRRNRVVEQSVQRQVYCDPCSHITCCTSA